MALIKYHTNFRKLVVGVDTYIPLNNGRYVPAINFDNAATTPPFTSALQEIINFAPWYSSIHRGKGYKSQYSSELYEKARIIIGNFVKADLKENALIFVKNTTEAINKLSNRLCKSHKKYVILSTDMEHHSNDLPWRNKYKVDYVSLDNQGHLSLEDLEAKLKKYKNSLVLVTVTGASNVTGYKNPIHQIAALAHQYNSKILVDGAQLVPHTPVDMKPMDSPDHIDFLVFSSHKMYAPFGIGVLIGPKPVFKKGAPDYAGGGTVEMVTHDFIRWASPPYKDEAGSPNIIGVVALSAAIQTLQQIGMKNIEKYENSLTDYALHKIKNIPDIKLYCGLDIHDERVGIVPFNIKGIPHETVATILSNEGGIAVRNGCFCAQPYIQKLLHLSPKEIEQHIRMPSIPQPGMVRISFGLYNNYREIDTFIHMLHKIVENKNFYKNKYKLTIHSRKSYPNMFL
jgi:cysteine desulfurase/selenocysteine lyase